MMMTGFMTNFPILSIISLFLGAFITALVGRKNKIVRNTVVAIAVTLPLIMMFSLIKPIMVEGQTIAYWMGGWAPAAGWAIGIGLEVDALSLFFGLIVTVAVFVCQS